MAGVESIRGYIAHGDIYQANLTRRLEAPFDGDPWPLYRRLRTGDPSLYAAYVDLGGRRAILSASPEPFLSVDAAGHVTTDPIKGTRPRGRTREEDRALACELMASEKDRAENVMIVDVLRNDLGRVCAPGTVRVPRLCRLERTAAVQHLVSTVTGRLAPGRDSFDLLAASFPGGSITGAPKIRAMELLEELEPVRRGPYTGALGWIGPDGAMATSILIRTFVADGARLASTSAAGSPTSATRRPSGRRPSRRRAARSRDRRPRGRGVTRSDRPARARLGRRPPRARRRASPLARSIAASSSATACSRRCARAAAVRPSSRSTSRACAARRTASSIPLVDDIGESLAAAIADAAGRRDPRRTGRRRQHPHHGVTWRVLRSRLAPTGRASVADDRGAGLARPPTPASHLERGLHLVASRVRRDPENPLSALKTTSRADYVYARVEARTRRRRRCALPDDRRLPVRGDVGECLPRPRARELATPGLGCAILPGTTRDWILRWASGAGLQPSEAWLTPRDLAEADEAFLSSSVAGILPVTRFEDEPIGAGMPGTRTLRARADREAYIGRGSGDG